MPRRQLTPEESITASMVNAHEHCCLMSTFHHAMASDTDIAPGMSMEIMQKRAELMSNYCTVGAG